ncbi:hypothetical protein ACJX0J_033816, partial [Zea mays]
QFVPNNFMHYQISDSLMHATPDFENIFQGSPNRHQDSNSSSVGSLDVIGWAENINLHPTSQLDHLCALTIRKEKHRTEVFLFFPPLLSKKLNHLKHFGKPTAVNTAAAVKFITVNKSDIHRERNHLCTTRLPHLAGAMQMEIFLEIIHMLPEAI